MAQDPEGHKPQDNNARGSHRGPDFIQCQASLAALATRRHRPPHLGVCRAECSGLTYYATSGRRGKAPLAGYREGYAEMGGDAAWPEADHAVTFN